MSEPTKPIIRITQIESDQIEVAITGSRNCFKQILTKSQISKLINKLTQSII